MEHSHHNGESEPIGHDYEQHAHSDWGSEEFVAQWLVRQEQRADERRRQFLLFRALITKRTSDEFGYLNLGAGPGALDEILLEHFEEATATLVDSSLPMLEAAQQRLARFGSRVEYIQADLGDPDWTGAVGGPFDFVVSTLAIHHLEEPRRIRELYSEIYRLLAHGGMFLNLDYVRPVRAALSALTPWAALDPEAGFNAHAGRHEPPATLTEQLGWLAEAGFPCVDVLWKELQSALVCGLRDHLHMPEAVHDHGSAHDHPHPH